MSASSGRDVIKNGLLSSDLDAQGFKITNADLSESTTTPADVPEITATSSVLKGDGAGNAVAAVARSDFWGTDDFVGSGASHRHGLVPDPGASSGSTNFLCEDGTWTEPAGDAPTIETTSALLKGDGAGNAEEATLGTDYWDDTVFVASGASHAIGLVPDPGASAGSDAFLCEDGTWAVPPASAGVTIASTSLVIKGDGAGGGVAATPGTDYVAPSTALTRLTAASVVISGTTPAINWNSSTVFTWTTSGTSTPTFSNETDSFNISIVVTNGASHTITWPAAVQWANGGTQPTQSVAGKKDYWGFSRVGSVTYGAVLADMQ